MALKKVQMIGGYSPDYWVITNMTIDYIQQEIMIKVKLYKDAAEFISDVTNYMDTKNYLLRNITGGPQQYINLVLDARNNGQDIVDAGETYLKTNEGYVDYV